MLAREFITEKKKKKKRKSGKTKLNRYFFPGFAYYGFSGDSGDSGGGDGGGESIHENLPKGASRKVRRTLMQIFQYILRKQPRRGGRSAIDKQRDREWELAGRPENDAEKLYSQLINALYKKGHDFEREYTLVDLYKMPEIEKSLLYIIAPLFREDAEVTELTESELDLDQEVKKFVAWAAQRLHIKQVPKVILSYDHEEAQKNHHTGSHVFGSGKVWVYAKNRNLVDILRTVFHELVHVRQEELNMVKPGSSYPGSPIEAMADMLAGKYIKIYGKANRKIFQ